MTTPDGPTPEPRPVTTEPTGEAPATPRPARAAAPLLLAVGLALAAHALTVGTRGVPGVNVALWVALFSGVTVWGVRGRGERPTREALILLGLALAFAVTFAVWAAPGLFAFLDTLALGLCLVLGAAFLRHPRWGETGVGALLGTMFTGGLRFVYGPFVLLERFPWARVRPRAGGGFARLVSNLFDWDLSGVAETVWRLIGWGAFAGGLVYPALLALRPTVFPVGSSSGHGRLGLVEVGLPLGALGALFTVFLATQLPYFLSGSALPEGFTFADYVRRGFGELMVVGFLTLVLLLAAHGVTRGEDRRRAAYRALNLAVLGPLALILLGAANRWRLYTLAYGLSEIRVLGAAFLAWIVLALGWLAFLLWRGDLRRFAYPALLAGLAGLLGATVLNPGALIARVNVGRALSGTTNEVRRTPQGANVGELLNLGADAVPVVVANRDTLTCGPTQDCPNGRAAVLQRLREEYGERPDPRTWNASRERVRRLVRGLE